MSILIWFWHFEFIAKAISKLNYFKLRIKKWIIINFGYFFSDLFVAAESISLDDNGSSFKEISETDDFVWQTNDEKRLVNFVMRHYDSTVRPLKNASDAIVIRLGITLTQIFDLVSDWHCLCQWLIVLLFVSICMSSCLLFHFEWITMLIYSNIFCLYIDLDVHFSIDWFKL